MVEESEFKCLARVLRERRQKHHLLLTAWVFLPDNWHAIIFPRFPVTISRVMESIKEKTQSL
jgi:REP element-mobilizing transposase RayT